MVIRRDDARRLHLTTLSEAAQYTPQWHLGVDTNSSSGPMGCGVESRRTGLTIRRAAATMDLGCCTGRWRRIR